MKPHDDLEVSRRELLIGGSAGVAGVMIPSIAKGQNRTSKATEKISKAKVSLKVNGKTHALNLDTRTSLLDTLREHLHLTGSKKGCDQGQCGA